MTLSEQISGWIAERVREAKAEGVVLGLSGGVDSSLTAALAKKALGDKVLGLLMPCHSDPTDLEHARLVAARFDIETEYVDLGPVFDSLMAALPRGSDIAVANLKPRLRMATLYYFANSRNYLVAGTGNKSELTVGYFTKYGDGGADLLPLGDLLKSQVRELTRELGVPEEIIAKPPSAGLWAGQTDEGEMGITYDELDRTIAAIEKGDTRDCDEATVERVKAMRGASEHKRLPIPICEIA
ncbi:MAG: NAD+ synthase [Anaerolineales bacterium]|nr:MAG: NAD+ synthase [Anaerolineales bacterium]